MAAVDLVLSRLRPDDLVVAPHHCYAGTYRLIGLRAGKGQFAVAFTIRTIPPPSPQCSSAARSWS